MSDIDDEFVPEEDAENPAGAIKKLRDRASKAEEEAKTNLEGWQRSQADLANYKKDEATQRQYMQERTKAGLAEELIPVLDSFEMSAKHGASKELEVLYKQLLGTLKRMGIEQYGAAGEKFDPHKHEALREVAVDSAEKEHTIVSVERSGYSIGDFVIRPAQVSVGSYKQS
ncbi:MAG TPA: nucleotide exchange factor GrpE [Candidatus Paceibacterota bacterium]|nr:nucleotide exchange factor GrpE [Candidatus Paceibacterota bacterium]